MFSLSDLDSDIVKVIFNNLGFHVFLPTEEALKQLDYRCSKIFVNDKLEFAYTGERSLDVLRGNHEMRVNISDKFMIELDIREGDDIRWQCEPSIIRLWTVQA